MRLGILAQPDSFYFADLARAAPDAMVYPLSFTELRGDIGASALTVHCGDIDLRMLNAVLVRTMPPGSLEQVVLRMDLLAMLEASGTLVINPAKSLETAVDKYLTSAKLKAAEISTPRTIVCQGWQTALEAFEALGGKAVVKPLFGGEGRGISLLTDVDMAHRAFKLLNQLGAVIYLQEYIAHGDSDIRVLFIGDEHYTVKRMNADDFRTNASRGAITLAHQPTERQLDLAFRARDIVGAPIAGIDVLTDLDGRDYIIEVNAVPGWKATAKAVNVDIAERVIHYVAQSIDRRRGS
jgi:RimK family alpha-L-glutamate ligase